ncbi:MAG TPA: hypothetical protein VF522_22685 [Ramlibacter sp.]|uniref:hypothetical protein n=1 Tax=Ramlibacter sp. TaxID=1917967 RepID=UPI002ED470E8
MSSSSAVLWLVAAVVGLALLLYVAGLAKRALERRARKLRYQRLGRETGPHRPLSQPGVLYSGMGPERAAAIRQDAEAAARLVASGQAGEPRNPHPASSPEFVLWVATYHLTLADLADELPASGAAAWQPKPPPEHGASRH